MELLWSSVEPYKFPNTQYTLRGYSRAAYMTSFVIPELDIMLDCGVPNAFFPQYVFITHGHIDHVFQLPLCSVKSARSKTIITKKPTYYVPHEMCDHIDNFIFATYMMSKNNTHHRMRDTYNIVGVQFNDTFDLVLKKQHWKIQVFRCDHRTPCAGYGFNNIRKKLNAEYVGKTSNELKLLKQQGIDIMVDVDHHIFCYLGDSSIAVFDNTDIFNYNTIIVECTYLYEDDIVHADKNKHIHWLQLEEIVYTHPHNIFILIHFSQRYSNSEIWAFFEHVQYKNIVIWCEKDK